MRSESDASGILGKMPPLANTCTVYNNQSTWDGDLSHLTFACRAHAYEDPVRQFLVDELDGSVANESANFLQFRRRFGVGVCAIHAGAAHAFVHGVIRQAVGVLVQMPKHVLDLKSFQLVN